MDKPDLVASFVLDQDGKPKITMEGDTKHYWIQLGVETPPPDAYAVTYRLHESYYDPIRESRAKDANFPEQLTSYGDFQLRADIRTKQRVEPISANLSQALLKGYKGRLTPDIEAAIKDIEKH
jgi:hypothetical protein